MDDWLLFSFSVIFFLSYQKHGRPSPADSYCFTVFTRRIFLGRVLLCMRIPIIWSNEPITILSTYVGLINACIVRGFSTRMQSMELPNSRPIFLSHFHDTIHVGNGQGKKHTLDNEMFHFFIRNTNIPPDVFPKSSKFITRFLSLPSSIKLPV